MALSAFLGLISPSGPSCRPHRALHVGLGALPGQQVVTTTSLLGDVEIWSVLDSAVLFSCSEIATWQRGRNKTRAALRPRPVSLPQVYCMASANCMPRAPTL
jgi:hypothetical protein